MKHYQIKVRIVEVDPECIATIGEPIMQAEVVVDTECAATLPLEAARLVLGYAALEGAGEVEA